MSDGYLDTDKLLCIYVLLMRHAIIEIYFAIQTRFNGLKQLLNHGEFSL